MEEHIEELQSQLDQRELGHPIECHGTGGAAAAGGADGALSDRLEVGADSAEDEPSWLAEVRAEIRCTGRGAGGAM